MQMRCYDSTNETTIITSETFKRRGWQRKELRKVSLWGFLALLFLCPNHIGTANAKPVAQPQEDFTSIGGSTLPAISSTASPSNSVNVATSTTASSSMTSSSKTSSHTTSIPGTVVTDSPLVKTSFIQSSLSASYLVSSINGSHSSISTSTVSGNASLTSFAPTIIQPPTMNDNNGTGQDNTYNSLVNFYFLILAGLIALAVLAWYLWRRRRKGKNKRDQRRGLEALRQDLELGRIRRGLLGVVGKGNNSPSAANEELPAYVLPFRMEFMVGIMR